jgi:tetratricopeptide (TPR) repeat protein
MIFLSWGLFFCLFFQASGAFASLPDIEAALLDKNYNQSRLLASRIVKESMDPAERIEAQYYLGLSQLRLGKYPEARKAFQVVMTETVNPELYDKAGLGMIEGLYLAGFYKDALRAGESLLRKNPKSQSKSLIFLKIARTHLKLMHWKEAKEYLQKITSEFPESFEASIAKGLLEEREYFAVQVGSFLDRSRAIRLAESLKAQDQYAYIVETSSASDKTFYRVRVGQLTSLSDAQALESTLANLGYPTRIYP